MSQSTSSKLRTGFLPMIPSLSATGNVCDAMRMGNPSGDGTGNSKVSDTQGLWQLPSRAIPSTTWCPACSKADAIVWARLHGPPMRDSANMGTTSTFIPVLLCLVDRILDLSPIGVGPAGPRCRDHRRVRPPWQLQGLGRLRWWWRRRCRGARRRAAARIRHHVRHARTGC